MNWIHGELMERMCGDIEGVGGIIDAIEVFRGGMWAGFNDLKCGVWEDFESFVRDVFRIF